MPLFISGSNGISGADGTAALPAVQGTDGNTGIFFPAPDQVAIATGGVQRLLVDASGNVVVAGSSLYPLVQGTAVASTSGTAIDFTGIPSWVRRITILFNGVSTNDASNLLLQIGDAGGIESTGYVGGSFNTGVAANSTAGFDLTAQNIATATWGGSITLTSFGGNTWCEAGVISSSSGGYIGASGGVKTLSDTLDRVRITSVTGAATFDAGSINILYE